MPANGRWRTPDCAEPSPRERCGCPTSLHPINKATLPSRERRSQGAIGPACSATPHHPSPSLRSPQLHPGEKSGLGSKVRDSTPAVHPRARGEHTSWCQRCSAIVGSSPRSRGTLLELVLPILKRGSSPRSRGTHRVIVLAGLPQRFIPALAGNTLEGLNGCSFGRFIPALAGNTTASSRPGRTVRFIPALAGNTAQTHSWPSGHGSSPRSRGTLQRRSRRFAVTGSSPRSAGNTPNVRSPEGEMRFIPALAGNTAPRARSPRRVAVHPRARGEHAESSPAMRLSRAVHPRARGEHSGSVAGHSG